jgi:hypothetical protein
MRKTLIALAAVATIGVASVAAPQQAEARWGHGGGAFIGGLAAGAIIGGALASPYYGGYGYGYGYGPYYGGYASPYYGGYAGYGGCYRQRIWTPYGWRFRRVCY